MQIIQGRECFCGTSVAVILPSKSRMETSPCITLDLKILLILNLVSYLPFHPLLCLLHTHTHLYWALLSSSCTDTMSYGGTVVLKASSLFSVSAWVTFTLSLSNSHRSREDRGGLSCSLPCCKTSWHSKERSRLPQAGCN